MMIGSISNKNSFRMTEKILIVFIVTAVAVAWIGIQPLIVPEKAEANSSTPNASEMIANGPVYAVEYSSNWAYIGGDFTWCGPDTGYGAPVDQTNGQPVATYPKVNGTVYAATPDGSGGFYIGGYFTYVGGVTRNNIAHIEKNGSDYELDADWNPNANYIVKSLALSGSTLYVGGDFTSIGGATRNHVAALEGATGSANSWDPDITGGVSTTVNAITVSGTTVYVGGDFDTINSTAPPTTRNNIAAIDGSGGPTAWDPNITGGNVYALANDGTDVYAGGDFTTMGGLTMKQIAKINPSGGGDLSWSPDTIGNVYAMVLSGSNLYVGGSFTHIGGRDKNRVAALAASDGTAYETWNPNANGTVRTMALYPSNNLYLGGEFTTVGGAARIRAAAVDPTVGALGSLRSWDPSVEDNVLALAMASPSSGPVFIGGEFMILGGEARNYGAALSGTGLTIWNPNANGPIRSLAISEHKVYAGGDFTDFGGTARNHLAALNEATGSPDGWDPDITGTTVNAIKINGSTLYAGGEFSAVHGTGRNLIAAIDTGGTGEPVAGWDPNITGPRVKTLALGGSVIYIGGSFTYVGTYERNRIAAIGITPGPDYGNATDWNPDSNAVVDALEVDGFTVYAGGAFSHIGGENRSFIAALDADPSHTGTYGKATTWNPGASNWVYVIKMFGDNVLVGGLFASIGGQARNCAAIIDEDGNATSWSPDITRLTGGAVHCIDLGDLNSIYVGGRFTDVGGQFRPNFARFDRGLPTITGLDKTSARIGQEVTIYGTEFGLVPSASYVSFNFIPATSYPYWSDTQITVLVPSGAKTGPLKVNNGVGESSPVDFSVTPWIEWLEPGSGRLGDPVIIHGSGFGAYQVASTVKFTNNVTATCTEWAEDHIHTLVPAGAVSGNVTVTVDGVTGTGSYFTVTQSEPVISSISPSSGPVETKVTIAGNNFGSSRGGSFVTFNSLQATSYGSWSNTQIEAFVPAGAATGEVKVDVNGLVSNGFVFTVTATPPAPVIKNVVPAQGRVGDTVTIVGTNFGNDKGPSSKVMFGNKEATDIVYWSDSTIRVKIPAGVSSGVVVVYTYSGKSNVNLITIVVTPTPIINGITPGTGSAGNIVTITGRDFGSSRDTASYVTFNNKVASYYLSWSGSKIEAAVPQGATSGRLTVTTGGGTSNNIYFSVLSNPCTTWYLAEGTTAWGFDTYISIENPLPDQTLTARITYMTKDGPKQRPDVRLPALSQTTIDPRGDIGNTDFSTKIECRENKPIVVDRTMSWTGDGATSPEAHCSVGVTFPNRVWFLPEGSSKWGFECWLLLQNPNNREATCQVTYMVEGGQPVTKEKKIPANSRRTYSMKEDIGEKDASIRVVSDLTVNAERAMYRYSRREGHESIGTTMPAVDYYLAEGTSAWGFTTYVLVQNPNTDYNDVTVTYMTTSGPKVQAPFRMDPNSRKTIRVNDALPNTDFSTKVHGTKQLIAERAMYWGAGTPLGEACHDSIGLSEPYVAFGLPDGQTSDGRETWTLVQNPNPSAVTVEISYLTPSGEGDKVFTETIGANSRRTFNMADKGINGRAAVLVISKTAGKKVIVERAMYWNGRGAGTDTIGGYTNF